MHSRFACLAVAGVLAFLEAAAKASEAPIVAATPTAAPTPPDTKPNAYDERGVVNNLYTLDAAAKKFFLLHKAVKVTYAELVGPGKLVEEVHPVAGEDYTQLVFEKGQRIEVRMSDGTIIRYPLGSGPVSTPAASKPAEAKPAPAPVTKAPPGPLAKSAPETQAPSIVDNLKALSEAADKYYRDNDTTSTTYWQLVGPEKYIASIKPKEGEDYRSLLFKKGHPLRLYMKDGRVIVFPPPPPPQKAP